MKETLEMCQFISLICDLLQFWEIYRFLKVKEYGTVNYKADYYTGFLLFLMFIVWGTCSCRLVV